MPAVHAMMTINNLNGRKKFADPGRTGPTRLLALTAMTPGKMNNSGPTSTIVWAFQGATKCRTTAAPMQVAIAMTAPLRRSGKTPQVTMVRAANRASLTRFKAIVSTPFHARSGHG
jgi:hypothetical protein